MALDVLDVLEVLERNTQRRLPTAMNARWLKMNFWWT